MKINNFRGELTDNSAKKEPLVVTSPGVAPAVTQPTTYKLWITAMNSCYFDVGIQLQ